MIEAAEANAQVRVEKRMGTMPPSAMGLLFSALMVGVGLIFRTYDIAIADQALEFSRQIGLPFLLAEMGVIFWASRNGFQIDALWQRLSRQCRAALLLFLTTFWISSAFVSPYPIFSMALSLGTVVHLLFAASLAHLAAPTTPAEMNRMAMWMAGGTVVLAGMTALHILAYPADAPVPPADLRWDVAAVPGFISLRLFGAIAGALLSFALGLLLFQSARRQERLWHYAIVFLFSGLVVWSGTRAAVVGTVVAVAAGCITCRMLPSAKLTGKILLCVAAGGLTAQLLIPYDHPNFYLFDQTDVESVSTVTSGRDQLWMATLEGIAEVPLLGAGAAGSALMVPEASIDKHVQPHNFVLQFLASWGLAGALPAFFLLAVATWKAHFQARRQQVLLPLLLMLDGLLVMALFDGVLYFGRHLMLVMTCYALIFATGRADAGNSAGLDSPAR